MAPSENNVPVSPRPYVNYCFIALNFIVFAWELSLGSSLPKVGEMLGFVPARFLDDLIGQLNLSQAVLPLFTSLFLHGNVIHLMPNIFFLYIFGEQVETTLGHVRYLLFYVAGGVGANLIYFSFSPFSTVPLIGASGAIAGVMAAYLSLVPGTKWANLFIIAWVVLQFIYAIFASVTRVVGQTGMAWWAHVGGFLIGLVLIRFLAPPGVQLIPYRSRRQKPTQD